MRRISLTGGILLSIVLAANAFITEYPDTLWIPVIFYDYWVDDSGTNPDFQSVTSAQRINGMVATTLDTQKKPVPTTIACPSPDPGYPRACHLSEWFRVSGQAGSDASCLFQCDSITNPRVQRWYWTTAAGGPLTSYQGRVGEYIGPNYNATYNMRNIIIYDSLPFYHLGITNPNNLGVYEYTNSNFFLLDGKGFGTQPQSTATTGHNFGFVMEMHTTFRHRPGITFNFVGDDDVWAFVNNQLVMDIGGRHVAIADSFNLDNVSGLQLDSSYTFDFFYAERFTTRSSIRITTNIITAQPSKLTLSVTSDTICAGDTTSIIGTVIDQFGRSMQKQADSIVWTIDPATYRPGDSILVPQGATTVVTGTMAWRGFYVIATFKTLTDTAFIYVKACTPARVDIELQNITALTEAQVLAAVKLNDSTPRITVTLDSTLTRMYVYAVLRDVYNNFVDLARAATWSSEHNDSATVTGTAGKLYEGLIVRDSLARTGRTEIYASTTNLQPDTALVILRTDRIIALRLVDIRQPNVALDTIKMNTDQSMTIQVQGQWSTAPTVWVNVTGMWSMDPANLLKSVIPLPTTETGLWQYDPINSGRAILTVVNGTATVSVPVIITDAPPSRLVLTLVNHPDSCYAGVPIKIAASIFNNDGLVQGQWDGTSVYSDILDNTLRTFLPWLTVNNRTTPDSLNKPLPERFLNGNDTILLVLYYAPLSDDSLHQIRLALSGSPYGTLNAETIRFKLKPGPIDSIQIEDNTETHLVDTIRLESPNGSIGLFVKGFDKYGNRIVFGKTGGDSLGSVIWRADSTLHPTLDSIGPNITYVTNKVVYPETGRMWTILVVNGDTLKDFVPIVITAPKTSVTRAVTRDLNGNGFIDRIEVNFNKTVTLTSGDISIFNMVYPVTRDATTSGKPTTATAITKRGDSSYAIDFIELKNPAFPQSAWTPDLQILTNNRELSTGKTRASDGCPPVVWKVVKYVSRNNKNMEDTVVVDFSEAILASNGSSFDITQQPVLTFNVWQRKPDSTFVLLPDMLQNITAFLSPRVRDSSVCFLMSNGNDLYNKHWLNIKTTPPPSPVLRDKAVGNIPDSMNQKVNVLVKNGEPTLIVIPNPSRGTFQRVTGGVIQDIHNDAYRTWVINDRAGTVISIGNLRIPNGYSLDNPATWPKGYIKIYDVVGNTVNSLMVSNWLNGARVDTSSSATVDRYWNGANSKGMMAASNVYRVVAYIDFPASEKDLHDKRLIVKVGILR
jgi:fibro-slime domain-containing protein